MFAAKPILPLKLNVCLIARHFPINARAAQHAFLSLIARGLVQKGHKVTVISDQSGTGKSHLEMDGVQFYFVAEGKVLRRKDSFADLMKVKFTELHHREPFHLVHSVDDSAYRIGRFKDSYGIAMAYDVDATQLSSLFSIMAMSQETIGSLLGTGFAVAYTFLTTYFGGDRKILKSANGIFVTSPQQRIALERYYLYPDARIYTVPYGIEIGDLTPREKPEELRKRLNIPEASKIVVTVNDMTATGEIHSLLQAFEQVAIKKPSARLIVIGQGPHFKEIEFEALNLALGSKVIFAGAVKAADIPDYISLADVFVNLSSRTSGFETTLLEAMAQKKVIIGSEVSPISTIVEHSRDGFLIRPADVTELTQLLFDIFNDHLPVLEIGERAREKVTNLFDSEKMVVETLNAYYNILRSTGRYSRKK